MKRYAWMAGGWLCLAMAYIGVVTPGIPFSHFLLGAAFCFAKSSPKMHAWLMNHPKFGPFIRNWNEKKVFPTIGKIFMVAMMMSSLIIMWYTGVSTAGIGYTAMFMTLVVIWGWRYPGSPEEYDRRLAEGRRIAWLK
jgi:uncharacterized membrane protein YbaN (DUF454 family)